MKWSGLSLAAIGGWQLWLWWYDRSSGMTLTFSIAIVAGIVLFFEGLKREIVAEVRRNDQYSSGQ